MHGNVYIGRAATFTCVNGTVSRFCNKRLQNWPAVYLNFTMWPASWFVYSIFLWTFRSGSSISLFVFSDLVVFDKVSTAIRITLTESYDKEHFFKFFAYQTLADSGSTGHKNVPNIVSLSHCLEQIYSCIFNSYVKACLNIWLRRMYGL